MPSGKNVAAFFTFDLSVILHALLTVSMPNIVVGSNSNWSIAISNQPKKGKCPLMGTGQALVHTS